ncbi:hypothetical protein Echvi_4414 [Echinicola vietnamensis DSM 17526]|uniref:Uncharacterized protein n=1 Tax=Echinicola vietnamensis (strain DSM 17526 / LMG 23754 / KMM 6221) TaxID=926556 RepID=L0G5M6_ECHVK|nr:hypothetical protein Echvi_4414 [Echinicola vietnamensis DSM 17526]
MTQGVNEVNVKWVDPENRASAISGEQGFRNKWRWGILEFRCP